MYTIICDDDISMCYRDIKRTIGDIILIDTDSIGRMNITQSTNELMAVRLSLGLENCKNIQRPKLIEFANVYLVDKEYIKCIKIGYDFIIVCNQFDLSSHKIVSSVIDMLNIIDKLRLSCALYY